MKDTGRMRVLSFLMIRALALVALFLGVALLAGGVYLVYLGGSLYFLGAGAGWTLSGVLLWRRSVWGTVGLLGVLAATLLWSYWDAGVSFWPLFSRLLLPALLAFAGLLLAPWLSGGHHKLYRVWCRVLSVCLFAGLLTTLLQLFSPHGRLENPQATRSRFVPIAGAGPIRNEASNNWAFYGKDAGGSRFAEQDQITPANVGLMRVAWQHRTGDLGPGEEQNVPLFVDGLLYTCSRRNRVTALDADTGQVEWSFDPKASSPVWQRCRGLGHYRMPAAGPSPRPMCSSRILLTTIDARLIALDALTGRACEGFGNRGSVDLKQGMGEVKPGFYFQTSAPLVARGRVIIGGWVRDNQARGEPSGVVRAFDASTGALDWAWDLANPGNSGGAAADGQYTRGTPNMWSTPSYDDALGLLYLPMGNATPDYFGAGRSAASETYASSLVALEIETGRLRWTFQTVHHDLWDYDVSSQPTLVDLPGPDGITKAVAQPTKRGQIFLLDRTNGKPLSEVVEKPVPQSGKAPEEWLSPTQPYSVGMPSIGTTPLSESRMWGMTLLDQLYCRIQFRKSRYEGEFTPPGTRASIEYPGNYGGMNWGSASLDPRSATLFVNDIRMPVVVRLMSHEEADAIIASRKGAAPNRHGPAPQKGTPYGVSVLPMMSPLGIPCSQPPYGTISAIDLRSRKLLWEIPAGTVRDTGPLGVKTRLPVPIGMPTISGTMATSSGLLFFAGTQDYYLRAYRANDGEELWKGRLPVGSSATPITYTSPRTGKQYVVISAGGAPSSSDRGDYVIAYSL